MFALTLISSSIFAIFAIAKIAKNAIIANIKQELQK
jgi:hypothetical protein